MGKEWAAMAISWTVHCSPARLLKKTKEVGFDGSDVDAEKQHDF